MRTSDVIKIVFLGTVWGGPFAFIRVCAPIIGAVWFTLGRLIVASIVLLAWARWSGVDLAFRRYWKQYFVVGLLNTAGPWTLYAFAGKTISASYMSIINSSTPWMSAILGAWFLGEKMTWPKAIGLACGVLGLGSYDRDAFDRAALPNAATADFVPVEGSRIGELAADWDIVLGLTPADG